MKSKSEYRTSIPDEILNEIHEPISFEDFVMPALQFDMKAYRKRLTKDNTDKKLQKRTEEIKEILMLQLYFAKHFVPLHRRLCLTLVKIANFNSGSIWRHRRQFIQVGCPSVHIDECLAILYEV